MELPGIERGTSVVIVILLLYYIIIIFFRIHVTFHLIIQLFSLFNLFYFFYMYTYVIITCSLLKIIILFLFNSLILELIVTLSPSLIQQADSGTLFLFLSFPLPMIYSPSRKMCPGTSIYSVHEYGFEIAFAFCYFLILGFYHFHRRYRLIYGPLVCLRIEKKSGGVLNNSDKHIFIT